MQNILNQSIPNSENLKLSLNVEDGGFSLSVKSNQDLHEKTKRNFNRELQKSKAKAVKKAVLNAKVHRPYAATQSIYSNKGIFQEGKPSQIGTLLVAEA